MILTDVRNKSYSPPNCSIYVTTDSTFIMCHSCLNGGFHTIGNDQTFEEIVLATGESPRSGANTLAYNQETVKTLEGLRSAPMFADKTNQTNALFNYNLADFTEFKYTDDGVITFFIDKKGIEGGEKIRKFNNKHIRRELNRIEWHIDRATDNDFDIQIVKDPSKADIKIIQSQFGKIDNFTPNTPSWASGTWSSTDNIVAFVDPRNNKVDSKKIISHELGHVFGLAHPEVGYDGDHFNTVMGGPDSHNNEELTTGDLMFLHGMWNETHDLMYTQVL